MQHLDGMIKTIGKAATLASLTLALNSNVQAQIRLLIEPASITPFGAIGNMSGTQLMGLGGEKQVGGFFMGPGGSTYVRTSPNTIHELLPGAAALPPIEMPRMPAAALPPIHTISSSSNTHITTPPTYVVIPNISPAYEPYTHTPPTQKPSDSTRVSKLASNNDSTTAYDYTRGFVPSIPSYQVVKISKPEETKPAQEEPKVNINGFYNPATLSAFEPCEKYGPIGICVKWNQQVLDLLSK